VKTRKQKIKAVQAVVAKYDRLDSEWKKAVTIFGTHDNPLFEATWGAFDAYVSAVAETIGDDWEWLHWFIYENSCGRKGMEAKGAMSGLRKIKTAAQLVALIEEAAK
jgi:hypothetical protein